MPDFAPEHVAARAVLLDALDALGPQREAIIVVGAQAVYLRAGDTGITGVAPYTIDADLALAPARLADEPLIEKLMEDADFEQKGDPGVWWKTIDLKGAPDRLAEGNDDRIANKDAADVYRLMLAVPVRDFLVRLRPLLADDSAGPVCGEAVELMAKLFGARGTDGVRMAIDALRVALPPERVVDVCTGFVSRVREALEGN